MRAGAGIHIYVQGVAANYTTGWVQYIVVAGISLGIKGSLHGEWTALLLMGEAGFTAA